jgi:arylsulfatase A-like enzyme
MRKQDIAPTNVAGRKPTGKLPGKKGATRRQIIKSAAFAGVAATVAPSLGRAAAQSSKKPNILFVFSDQHRHDAIGAAGDPVIATPNIDRMAREGTLFKTMWCQSPVCRPSRASVLTGHYPHRTKIISNFDPDFDPSWPTFTRNLQAAGYETAVMGKTHFLLPTGDLSKPGPITGVKDVSTTYDYVKSFGYDFVREDAGQWYPAMDGFISPYTDFLRAHHMLEVYQKQIREHWITDDNQYMGFVNDYPQEFDVTSFVAREVIDWLEQRDTSRPFFVSYAPIKPHPPYAADPIWAAYYAGKKMPMGHPARATAPNEAWDKYLEKKYKSPGNVLTPEQAEESKRMYYAMISLIDQKVGEIMAVLEKRGELDNTWIIYSSDHGDSMGDHAFQGKSNFYHGVVGVPGIVRPPKAVMPGQVITAPVEAIDLSVTMLDIAGAAPLDVPGRSLMPAISKGQEVSQLAFSEIAGGKGTLFVAVRDGRYRYTVEHNSGTPCELFDLQEDPLETTNLVNDPGHAARVKKMQSDFIAPHMAGEVI